ncbi:hypothetical protein B0I35DRAFT_512651 [Stachybotrys elegans]|uniref:Apopolysialoglycoprotein n=1 Tax=Stachybotrys elegans TaxID=80388 RepID=A0A8K0WQ05_9HYPO|nr:hypothetical protein B0I35DRAFT_512651 [Stachybotrys elegans]
MAPGTRRANRSGFAEHDDFEGLPVRQWRQEVVSIAPPVQQDQQQQNDVWGIELFHGMPKDAHLLAPHSQELLRAARSGRLYKRPPPVEEEEVDAEVVLPDKPEKKEEDTSAKGFSVKLWKQTPRNVEAAGLSHLAKRRKGTVTIASKTVVDKVPGPTVTKATVKRLDAAGNPYTEDVTLVEGQQVDGEIISTRVEVAPAARPSAVAPVPPPPRRRPPPPKRKPRAGPGRGKKKLRGIIPGPATGVAITPGGTAPAPLPQGENGTPIKPDNTGTPNQDSEMADGDDDEEDDDDGAEGEDGDDGDDGDDDLKDSEHNDAAKESNKDQDEDMTDATPLPELSASQTPVEPKPDTTEAAPPPLSLAPALDLAKPEGSPLKNVVMQSPPGLPKAELLPTIDDIQMADTVPATESTVAEPPSTIVGEAPEIATDRDLTSFAAAQKDASEENALLPPPPEQVGNITSPKAENGPEKAHESEETGMGDAQPDMGHGLQRPALEHLDSVMTEDSIKPDDSASVTFPLVESELVSDVAPPAEPPKEPELQPEPEVEAQPEPQPEQEPHTAESESAKEPEPEAAPSVEAVVEEPEPEPMEVEAPAEESNILDGAMAELDRQARLADEAVAPKVEEPQPVPVIEPVSEAGTTPQPTSAQPTPPEPEVKDEPTVQEYTTDAAPEATPEAPQPPQAVQGHVPSPAQEAAQASPEVTTGTTPLEATQDVPKEPTPVEAVEESTPQEEAKEPTPQETAQESTPQEAPKESTPQPAQPENSTAEAPAAAESTEPVKEEPSVAQDPPAAQ